MVPNLHFNIIHVYNFHACKVNELLFDSASRLGQFYRNLRPSLLIAELFANMARKMCI